MASKKEGTPPPGGPPSEIFCGWPTFKTSEYLHKSTENLDLTPKGGKPNKKYAKLLAERNPTKRGHTFENRQPVTPGPRLGPRLGATSATHKKIFKIVKGLKIEKYSTKEDNGSRGGGSPLKTGSSKFFILKISSYGLCAIYTQPNPILKISSFQGQEFG